MSKIKRMTGFVDKGDRLRTFFEFEDGTTEEMEPEIIVEVFNVVMGQLTRWVNVLSKAKGIQDYLIRDGSDN